MELSRWLLGSVAVVVAGCTAHNPASCSDGSCTDPSLPFCDVDGSLGGQAQTCIAVSCTAGTFAACRGDVAITCNQGGDNYDEIKCDLGCDAASGGCRACMPSTTECANGAVSTCDAAGNVTAQTACPLGCFESEPRCRDIDPSNGLATYLDMVPNPPDLDLTDAIFDVVTGAVTDGGNPVTVPSFAVPAPANGVAVRVFIANTVTVKNMTAQSTCASTPCVSAPAFALVARGAISITGLVRAPRSGSVDTGACVGGQGSLDDLGGGDLRVGGGGGGGNATDGAKGGDVNPGMAAIEHGGAAGASAGTANLIPLRGGCASGGGGVESEFGGGAIQITSGISIHVDGTLDVRGANGGLYQTQGNVSVGFATTGGSAGGAVLLEAPEVTLGAAASLLATGGSGGQCPPSTTCGAGGIGATPDAAATAGGSAAESSTDSSTGGGGGGGLGRIRVNTPNQTYNTSNTTIQAGALSTGVLSTR